MPAWLTHKSCVARTRCIGYLLAWLLVAAALAPQASAQGAPVDDLRAQATGTALTLRWTHREAGFVRYEVWRSGQPYADVGDAGMTRLATVLPGPLDTEVIYPPTSGFDSSGIGSVTLNYFYAVRGVTSDGQASALSNRAGEFDFSLRDGHAGITQYDGPQTCLGCHATEGYDALHSEHMQWDGKWLQVNTYDTSPAPADYACLSCHASTGKVTDQTANDVDCLICHSDTYQRSLQPLDIPVTVTDWQDNTKTYMTPGKNAEGNYTMQPRFDLMPAGTTMVSLAQTVHLPTRAMCLRCHAGADGGDGVKRGDISTANLSPSPASDVHMSPQGGNFACQTCHVTSEHKIPGKGIDLRIAEGGAVKTCVDCHTAKPHVTGDVNKHTDRVACQTCHIAMFGKDVATEMSRDWRTPSWNPAGCDGQGAWEAAEVKASNVTPQYTFWDGTSTVYDLAQMIDPQPDGSYAMAEANGDINDVNSKLHPIKLHQAVQPRHDATGRMVQYDALWNFMTGKYEEAAARGVAFMGLSGSYSWVNTTAEQLITHGVEPQANALACSACHENTSRMDLPSLGYVLKGDTAIVCKQCHGSKRMLPFFTMHDVHVTSSGDDCSWCHSFTRPERGLTPP